MLFAPMFFRRSNSAGPDAGLPAANTTVSSAAALTTALNAAPSNTASTYIIDLSPGNYGDFTFPTNYSKGTTTVEVRGSTWNNLPVFDSIAATRSNRVKLNRLNVINTTLDQFGFPAAGPNGSNCVNFDEATFPHIRDVVITTPYCGLNMTDTKDGLVEYCRIEGFSMDGIRAFTTAGDVVENLTIKKTVVTCNMTPGTFPALTMHTGYNTDGSCAIDPRRSDQYGYQGTTDVLNLVGTPISVTEATKDQRHADCLQLSGQVDTMLIEDCEFIGWDGYCQILLLNNADANSNGQMLTDVVVNRCKITGADVHGVWWRRAASSCAVRNTVLRNTATRNWALNTPAGSSAGLTQTSIATVPNASWDDVEITNCVMPSSYSTTWYDAAYAVVSGLSFSDSALPTGWASGAVATGDIGQFGWYYSAP